jgi:hypothetical protein
LFRYRLWRCSTPGVSCVSRPLWADIARRNSLVEPNLTRLASALAHRRRSRPSIEVVTDTRKSRRLGFLDYQTTDDVLFDLFTRLRAERIIP